MTQSVKPEVPPRAGNEHPVEFSMIMASAVHDMKNSLGMLLHSLDELRRELPDQTAESRMNTLRYEAERVHGDLVQLLGLYRLDQDSLSARLEEHYLPDFIEAQIARHKPLLDGHGIEPDIAVGPLSGYFDADLLAGVINDTVNNAIRYTRNRIRISAFQRENMLVIQVADDGAGYPDAMLDTTRQIPTSIDFQQGHTRLGLFFAREIARLHRNGDRYGYIQLSNGGPLGGGVFEILLP